MRLFKPTDQRCLGMSYRWSFAMLAGQAASTSAPRAKSKAEELMEREMAAKRGREAARTGAGGGLADGGVRRDAPWLQTGIVVKVSAAEPCPSALRPQAHASLFCLHNYSQCGRYIDRRAVVCLCLSCVQVATVCHALCMCRRWH